MILTRLFFNFTDRLPFKMDEKEWPAKQISFSEKALERCVEDLGKVRSHSEFHDLLYFAKGHLFLAQEGDAFELDRLPWKPAFTRFFSIKPNTRNDEKLFLVSVKILFLIYVISRGFLGNRGFFNLSRTRNSGRSDTRRKIELDAVFDET